MKYKVYTDFGHGGYDPGACGHGYKEKDIVLSVGKLLNNMLHEDGRFEIKSSRVDDTFKTLEYRTNDANNWGANVFISIHCNSADDPKAIGVETYCYKLKYRELADCIQKSMLDNQVFNRNRGVKEGNFHVLRETSMSACLVELGFISNGNDIEILTKKQYQLARALYLGILKYFNLEEVVTPSDQLYIVSVGAFKDINNAKATMKKCETIGLKPYIHIHKEDYNGLPKTI